MTGRSAAFGWQVASRAWIAMPPPLVMGTSMLAWTKIPWPWPAVEWGAALCFGVLAVVARRKVRRGC